MHRFCKPETAVSAWVRTPPSALWRVACYAGLAQRQSAFDEIQIVLVCLSGDRAGFVNQ